MCLFGGLNAALLLCLLLLCKPTCSFTPSFLYSILLRKSNLKMAKFFLFNCKIAVIWILFAIFAPYKY